MSVADVTPSLMTIGGFFINEGSIPVWIGWLKYLSCKTSRGTRPQTALARYITLPQPQFTRIIDYKYAFAALMQLEYDNRSLNVSACDANGSFCPATGAAVLRGCKRGVDLARTVRLAIKLNIPRF
jgi:hypothetical protein